MDVLSIALLDNAYAEARLEITNSNRCGIFLNSIQYPAPPIQC